MSIVMNEKGLHIRPPVCHRKLSRETMQQCWCMNDSVGKFCTDKRTRRKKKLLEEYKQHEEYFGRRFRFDEHTDSGLSCLFRSFCSKCKDHFLLVRTCYQNFPTES